MRRATWVVGAVILAGIPLLFSGSPANAWFQQLPCDFMTGGGFIINATGSTPGAHANFGIGGGCKINGPNAPFWGHLEYVDHGTGLNVHGLSVTDYRFISNGPNSTPGQPTGTRQTCGTAETNNPLYPNVNYIWQASDNGEGSNRFAPDAFDMRLTEQTTNFVVYTTESGFPHSLGGGNIQLHKPNPSTAGTFGSGSCPAATPAG